MSAFVNDEPPSKPHQSLQEYRPSSFWLVPRSISHRASFLELKQRGVEGSREDYPDTIPRSFDRGGGWLAATWDSLGSMFPLLIPSKNASGFRLERSGVLTRGWVRSESVLSGSLSPKVSELVPIRHELRKDGRDAIVSVHAESGPPPGASLALRRHPCHPYSMDFPSDRSVADTSSGARRSRHRGTGRGLQQACALRRARNRRPTGYSEERQLAQPRPVTASFTREALGLIQRVHGSDASSSC